MKKQKARNKLGTKSAKFWRKPDILTINPTDLSLHIKAAARSGLCGGGFMR